MKPVPDLPLTLRVGGALSALETTPLPPYSAPAVAFLSELSKVLLALPAAREFPDIAAFGYWCRAANLSRMAREFDTRHPRLGRGLALHIAPANVPVNFAYSFAFGLLSGNANIVRIPDAGFAQVDTLCAEIARLFASPQHARIAAMNRLVTYPRSDEITAAISAVAQARVLWGGDQTVSHLRRLPAHPRCVDITFADRYSFCVMDAKGVLETDDRALGELTRGFYNDVFFLDQNACSSPHLVIWKGTQEAGAAKQRFWGALSALLEQKYDLAPVHAVDKYVQLCRAAITLPQAGHAARDGNLLYRVPLKDLPHDIERHRGQFGFFYEYVTDNLGCLASIVGERYQTLTCFGVDREAMVRQVIDQGLTGIDRVVPVGKALDMGVIWDGYDLIGTLTRIVSTA